MYDSYPIAGKRNLPKVPWSPDSVRIRIAVSIKRGHAKDKVAWPTKFQHNDNCDAIYKKN